MTPIPVTPMMATLIFLAVWMSVLAFILWLIVRMSRVPSLKTKRLYLDPSMGLSERRRLLANAKAGDADLDFYNYYVVMPGEDIPVFNPNMMQLAEAEFMIIEYFVPERSKAKAV